MSILYRFRVIAHFSSKVTNFNPPHLHLSPPYGMIPFEFRHDLWHQKTRIMGLSCGVVCVILRIAVLIQYQSVTDTQTHSHTTTANTALSIASCGKNVSRDVTTPLSGTVCCPSAGTSYRQPVHKIWSLYVYSLRRYERRRKMQKLG